MSPLALLMMRLYPQLYQADPGKNHSSFLVASPQGGGMYTRFPFIEKEESQDVHAQVSRRLAHLWFSDVWRPSREFLGSPTQKLL